MPFYLKCFSLTVKLIHKFESYGLKQDRNLQDLNDNQIDRKNNRKNIFVDIDGHRSQKTKDLCQK